MSEGFHARVSAAKWREIIAKAGKKHQNPTPHCHLEIVLTVENGHPQYQRAWVGCVGACVPATTPCTLVRIPLDPRRQWEIVYCSCGEGHHCTMAVLVRAGEDGDPPEVVHAFCFGDCETGDCDLTSTSLETEIRVYCGCL